MHQVVQEIKSNVVNQKRGIKSFFEETISDNIANNNGSIEDCVDFVPKFKDYKSQLYKLKHEQIPKLPKTIPEIDLTSEKYNATKDGRRFLLVQTENEIIIFS